YHDLLVYDLVQDSDVRDKTYSKDERLEVLGKVYREYTRTLYSASAMGVMALSLLFGLFFEDDGEERFCFFAACRRRSFSAMRWRTRSRCMAARWRSISRSWASSTCGD